jgi:hypothetical protein
VAHRDTKREATAVNERRMAHREADQTEADWALYSAAKAVLAAWAADDSQEQNDLSDEMWAAIGALTRAVDATALGRSEVTE